MVLYIDCEKCKNENAVIHTRESFHCSNCGNHQLVTIDENYQPKENHNGL